MSSIMKGIVGEGEEVAVIYIDGKPSVKYAKKHEADADASRMREKFPNKKIEIKHEVREDDDLEELDENLRKWFKEKWVRFGPDGKIRGACARGSDSEGKPKCLPQSKAHSIGKKGRKYAASKKRREDPNPERRGPAKNVATKKKTNEEKCPHCGGELVSEEMMNEKQDACYRKVKSRYKVWPSAYASGALVQCRKKGAANWGNKSKKNESNIMKGIVDEASGTPGGVEMFRTKDMVDLAMQQNLYKRDLEALKKAKQADKPKPVYRKREPVASGEEQSIHIASTAIPTALVKDWMENKSVSAVVDFIASRYAHRQSTKMIDEIKADPKFADAVSKFFDIAGKSLELRSKVKAANTTVNDSRFRVEAEDLRLSGFAAFREITNVIVDYMKKYGVDKTGRRVPPGFNYNLEEGVIVGHDANDPEVAILGGAGTMSLSRLKKKAHAEALQLADDIANGKYSASSYNMKQLHNTLNTIVAAEKEMEKLYFGEDYTGEFATEKTPAINPYGGQKDRQFRGAISETPTDNPTGASGEGGWRKYKPKSAGTLKEDTNELKSFLEKYPEAKDAMRNAVRHFEYAYDAMDHVAGHVLHKMPYSEWEKVRQDLIDYFVKYGLKADVNEEQLDEKCWDTHKQVGMKKKGGKMVPNCVPKESAILKGIKNRLD